MFTFKTVMMLCGVAAFMASASVGIAQERSAGNVTEMQTWSSLKSLVSSATQRAEVLDTKLQMIIACNDNFMLYVPGKPQVPGKPKGCIENTLIKNLESAVDGLKTKTDDTNKALDDLKGVVAGHTTDIKTIKETYTLKKDFIALRQVVDEHSDKLIVINGQLVTLDNRISSLRAYVDNADAAISGRVDKTDLRLTGVSNTVTATQKRVTKTETDITKVNTEVAEINQLIDDIKLEIKDVRAKVDVVEDKVTSVSNTVTLMKTNVDNLIRCGDSGGKIWDKSAGVCVAAGGNTPIPTGVEVDYSKCSLTKFSDQYHTFGNEMGMTIQTFKYGQHYCPKDYVMAGVNNGEVSGAVCCKMKLKF